MDKIEQLTNFLNRATSDIKLTSTHICLCTALCRTWIDNRFKNPFNISREQLMRAAKIKSKTTYHKAMTELVVLSYLRYAPTYHPLKGSQVLIIPLMD